MNERRERIQKSKSGKKLLLDCCHFRSFSLTTSGQTTHHDQVTFSLSSSLSFSLSLSQFFLWSSTHEYYSCFSNVDIHFVWTLCHRGVSWWKQMTTLSFFQSLSLSLSVWVLKLNYFPSNSLAIIKWSSSRKEKERERERGKMRRFENWNGEKLSSYKNFHQISKEFESRKDWKILEIFPALLLKEKIPKLRKNYS